MICMAPEREVCLDSLLQACQPQLLKLASFGPGEWLVHHVDEGWSSPERERCTQ